MPRTPRLLLSQSYYHVMTRGNNRHKVFITDEDYHYYLDLIIRFKADHPFDLFHYCLMPNHVHLLIKTNVSSDFSVFMKRLNLAYFHHYNKKYGWIGHFWQDRFKSQPIGKDEYFIQCGKYIELNPVRKKLVSLPEDYVWSSYRYYVKGISNSLITEDFLYDKLSPVSEERQRQYAQLIIDEIVEENYHKAIWGSAYQRYHETRKISFHKK